jgi:hypothetical protein
MPNPMIATFTAMVAAFFFQVFVKWLAGFCLIVLTG